MHGTITRSIRQRLAEISLAAGAIIIGAATLQDRPAQAIAGVGLMMLGATQCVMGLVERAVRDTSHERDRLQQALKEAQAEHARFLVARTFVDREAEDLCQRTEENERAAAARAAADAERLAAQAAADREELLAEMEDLRSSIKREGFLLGLDAGTRGIVFETEPPSTGARVIQMPRPAIGSDATTGSSGRLP